MSKNNKKQKVELSEADKAVVKKQGRRLIISSIVLVILIGAYFGLRAYNSNSEKKSATESQTEYLYTVAVSDVNTLSYTYGGEKYSFTKNDSEWNYDADSTIDVDESAISTMLGKICALEYDTMIEDVTDMDQYGLAADYDTICWTTSDNTYEIKVGSLNSITGNYYISAGENKVYIISSSLVSAFSKTIDDIKVEEEVTNTEESEEIETTVTEAAEN